MRRNPLLALAAAVLLIPTSALMHAQMGMNMPAPAPGTHISAATTLDSMIDAFENNVVPAAKAMPADKYNFAPSAATFAAGSPATFATVRTFAQQVSHLAMANYYFFGSASGIKPDVDVRAIGKLTSKDELVAALEKSFVFAHKAAATITDANAFEAIKPVAGQTTRFTVAAFAVAHGNDHYGQMVEYLRMNGIVPPASAKK